MILRQQSNRQSRRAAVQSSVQFVDDPAPCRGRHPFNAAGADLADSQAGAAAPVQASAHAPDEVKHGNRNTDR